MAHSTLPQARCGAVAERSAVPRPRAVKGPGGRGRRYTPQPWFVVGGSHGDEVGESSEFRPPEVIQKEDRRKSPLSMQGESGLLLKSHFDKG